MFVNCLILINSLSYLYLCSSTAAPNAAAPAVAAAASSADEATAGAEPHPADNPPAAATDQPEQESIHAAKLANCFVSNESAVAECE